MESRITRQNNSETVAGKYRFTRSWHAAVHGVSDNLATEQLEHWVLSYKVADSEDRALPVM